MRIFLRFSVGLFRQKTERIEVQPSTTTDELLEIVALRTGKPLDSFALIYRQEQVRVFQSTTQVRIIKGWPLSHYDIRGGLTFTVELYDEAYNLPQDSMKTSRLLNSVLPQASPFELSRIDETAEQHMRESLAGTVICPSALQEGDNLVLRRYLDEQLELLLKEVQKGSLEAVSRLLRDSPELEHSPELASQASQQKQLNMINELGHAGWGALHTAVYYEHPDLVSFFLIKNCDPNVVTTDGWTPLQLAVAKKNTKITQLLLDYPSVKVNELTARTTALHIAVREELPELVKLLMQHQANQHMKDEDGVAPIDMASNQEIKGLLLKLAHHVPEVVEHQAQPKFISEPPPILKGIVYKESALYKMKERYLVCNPYNGTLIRYENEQSCPKKPKETHLLTQISQIKILPKKELVWFMSKNYFYFQIFAQERIILGVKHEELAKRWVKGIFEASVFAMTHENKQKQVEQLALKAKTIVLDDKNNLINSPNEKQSPVRPRNNSSTPKRQQPGFFPLLKQMSQCRNNNSSASQTKEKEQHTSETREFTPSNERQRQFKKSPGTSVFVQKSAEEESLPVESINTPNFEQLRPFEDRPSLFEDSPRKSNLFSLKPESAKTTMISHSEVEPPKVKFSSFQLLKQIGSGSFGKVFSARLKSTGEIFALKALQKRALAAKRGMKYAISEAEILKSTDHPFIVRLHYTFQTMAYLYMCMDYCSRGDLSQYIAEKQVISQREATFIVGQILLALQYLHSRNIVYRDLKPENMLMGQDGYLKLADFGLSKQLGQEDSCSTFCGSLAYLSPEMLNNKQVGKHSDVYGMGCILYELLTGDPPYYDVDGVKLQNNIKEGRLKFPQCVSPVAKELLMRLLHKDTTKRISIKETKEHPFFRNLDFDLLLQKKIGKIDLPAREQLDSDQQEERINDSRPRFVDSDCPDNKLRTRVANYSFAKPAN